MLAVEGCKPFDQQAFLEGHMTPVLFGSALQGIRRARPDRRHGRLAPPPRAQAAADARR